MRQIMETTAAVALMVAGMAVAYEVGYEAGGIAEGPVDVSIVYEESGEARTVSLTDSEGLDIPTGSVAEEWPHMEHDYSEEN